MKNIKQSMGTGRRDEFIAGVSRQFPQFNSNYHSDARGASFPVSYRAELRRFRKLSSEFLGKETPRDYIKELMLFIIIVAVSAWPIALMLRALGELLK
jgi:hypothetical protein